ncbi:chitobiase/beta-hexosaminidase C-terminal domain-containing protein [Flagellimonas sp. S3867]|uniref:chitobiase/beta-hexosaminidase C-terminal domain-containing protein n=1 Tax=Flagellimonas sp. S3867 TaxID=2768063 RepID=UPI001687DF20
MEFLKAEEIQLAPPMISVDSLLFNETAHIKLFRGSDEADIRFTLDGSDVTSNSTSYTAPVTVSATTHLKVKAFHPDFNTSEIEERTIIKMANDISGSTISIQPEAHESYKAAGPNTLIDGRKGEFNFRSGDRWLGFQTNETVVNLEFSEAISMEKILVGMLQDHGSWIFLPDAIEIKASNKSIGRLKLKPFKNGDSKKMGFTEIPVEKGEYDEITITIHALNEIPEWHPGNGTLPWTFVDEILIE